MQRLSQDSFQKARRFVKTQARELDRRLFEYYFEGGQSEAVSAALAAYQNPDGGFGHALEPDFRTPASSALATTVAFQYLSDMGARVDHPLVGSGIQFLLDTYDNGWKPAPPAVNDSPRAPWWDYEEVQPEKHWCNPGAEIVGYLYQYAELVPDDFLASARRLAEFCLDTQPLAMEMHVFLCFVRLAARLPDPEKLYARLAQSLDQTVALDPADWNGYALRPWRVASDPHSPFAGWLDTALAANLDFEVGQQQPDGAWHPAWSWGQYEDDWVQAEREWKGVLTVKLLKTLHNFGRIEGVNPPLAEASRQANGSASAIR